MAYKYRWLGQALDDLSEEIGYVKREFGTRAARKAENRVYEGISRLCMFPRSGVRYKNLMYNGNEVRMLHLRQVSAVYCFDEEIITLIALWNSRRDERKLEQAIASR